MIEIGLVSHRIKDLDAKNATKMRARKPLKFQLSKILHFVGS